MMSFVIGAAAGGAVIFLCPGLGTGGNALYKSIRAAIRNRF